jgi:hypothetical protein
MDQILYNYDQQLAKVRKTTAYFDVSAYNQVVPGILVKLDDFDFFNVERLP